MNCHKTTFFRQINGITAGLLILFFLSLASFAQTAKISFDNLIAVTNENEGVALNRPRIVNNEKNFKEETENNSGLTAETFQMERKAFNVLNRKRAQNGLPQLVWSDEIAKIARVHSQEMAKFKFFSHAGRNGSMVDDRADLLGFKKWKAIGENIAYNRGFEDPAEFACERWMQSVSHRENILSDRWQEAGIGVATNVDGTFYFTEVFIAPR